MSVLIRGMKMPKAGQSIEIAEGMTGIIYGRLTPSLDDEWHEVIEVPPHGRLIEEPKQLSYGGLIYISPYDFIGTAKYFSDQVKAMPTIIEAEEV